MLAFGFWKVEDDVLYLHNIFRIYIKNPPELCLVPGQSGLITLKIEFDVWRRQLVVYTYFQIDSTKHVMKARKTLQKFKTHKNNCQNFENKIFAKHGTDTEKYLYTKCEIFILIYEAMMQLMSLTYIFM